MNAHELNEKLCKMLLGKPLARIGRVGDMIILYLGNTKIEEATATKRKCIKSEYGIHIGCPFHILNQNNVLVGSYDVYLNNDGNEDEVWKMLESTFFDQRAIYYNESVAPLHVEFIQVDTVGTLTMNLERGYVIKAFPNGSAKDEYWCFLSFLKNQKEFIVVNEDLVEEVDE